jgi:hypothetical protein
VRPLQKSTTKRAAVKAARSTQEELRQSALFHRILHGVGGFRDITANTSHRIGAGGDEHSANECADGQQTGLCHENFLLIESLQQQQHIWAILVQCK